MATQNAHQPMYLFLKLVPERNTCSSLWDKFRSLINRVARVLCCHKQFCASGSIQSGSKRRAKIILLGVEADKLAPVWLHQSQLIWPVASGFLYK
eukprot:6200305-Pleurochrysis_carterae.AAC.1